MTAANVDTFSSCGLPRMPTFSSSGLPRVPTSLLKRSIGARHLRWFGVPKQGHTFANKSTAHTATSMERFAQRKPVRMAPKQTMAGRRTLDGLNILRMVVNSWHHVAVLKK